MALISAALKIILTQLMLFKIIVVFWLELYAKIAGAIKAVPTKVARVIKAPGSKLARAIKLATMPEADESTSSEEN